MTNINAIPSISTDISYVRPLGESDGNLPPTQIFRDVSILHSPPDDCALSNIIAEVWCLEFYVVDK